MDLIKVVGAEIRIDVIIYHRCRRCREQPQRITMNWLYDKFFFFIENYGHGKIAFKMAE